MTELAFGNTPRPATYRDDYIDKPAGWAALGPRVIKGVCLHRTLGGAIAGTGDYFRAYDNRQPNGGHGWNALTDWGIGLDGVVLRWNADEWRAPHANGPGNDLEGDGVAFVRRYGAIAINRDLESIELEGLTYESPISAALMDSAVELVAWRIDHKAKIPWDVWPKNRDGLQAIYWHGEFGPKECPGPVVKGRTDELVERVGERLKRYQLGGTAPTSPPASRPPAALPAGMSADVAAWLFGQVTHAGKVFAFDARGSVSALWLAVGKELGEWPRLSAIRDIGSDRYFVFSSGRVVVQRGGGPPELLMIGGGD